MTKVGGNEHRVITSVLDLYLGMTGLNYESCLSNCTIYSQVADLKTCSVFFYNMFCFFCVFFFKRELVHRKESFKSPFQYKFITAIQFETYYHQVNKIYKEKLVEICLMN